MTIIGVESSAAAVSAAIVKDSKLISEAYLNTGLTHSQTLMSLVSSCLSNAGMDIHDADAFAVAKGPGSFTGVRIGVSAVKGLCFAGNIPVYGISTLEAMGYSAAVPDFIICPVMDARCSQVYTAFFEKKESGLVRLTDDRPLKLSELYDELKAYEKKVLLIGDGSSVTEDYLSKTDLEFSVFPEVFRFQRAGAVAFAAYMRYNNGESGLQSDSLFPEYLRPSQAEREKNNKENKNDSIKQ